MATEDLSALTGEWYSHWEKSMTRWWDQLLDDPTFIKGMGDNLAAQSRTRHAWEQQVDKTMENMHLPSRKDVVRVARIASLLEDKVLAIEDRLFDHSDALARVEKETLQARVDAAEALITVQEKLEVVEAKLDALTEAIAKLSPATPSRSTGRKTSSRSRKSSPKTDTTTTEG
jgi:hypothetical protein